jgi:DNA-binding Lrp family transcriptional regulator
VLDVFILVQATPGQAALVAEEVRSMEGVTEAETVTGPYDVIARVRVGNLDDLDVLITARLKTLDGVLRVLASTVVPEQKALD